MKSAGSSQFDARWTSTLRSALGHAGTVQANIVVAPSVDRSSVIKVQGRVCNHCAIDPTRAPLTKSHVTRKFQFTVVTRRITSLHLFFFSPHPEANSSFAPTSGGDVNELGRQRHRATTPRGNCARRHGGIRGPSFHFDSAWEDNVFSQLLADRSRSQALLSWHPDELAIRSL